MEWKKVDITIKSLIVKLWFRYRKYKTKCITKNNLYAFCLFLEQLKIHTKCQELNMCKILIKKSSLPLENCLYKHNNENLDDYKLLKKTMNEEWQTILNLFGF
tara:strand:- start:71 stop:379 length:309 start_codon:yes stop_codon:yes gene_type:complete